MAAALATPAQVRLIAPEIVDPPITDAILQEALDEMACLISVARFKECTSQVHSRMTAHCIVTNPFWASVEGIDGAETGLIASEADGPASRSFAAVASWGAEAAGWDTSFHGRKFLALRRRFRGRGSVIVANTNIPQKP